MSAQQPSENNPKHEWSAAVYRAVNRYNEVHPRDRANVFIDESDWLLPNRGRIIRAGLKRAQGSYAGLDLDTDVGPQVRHSDDAGGLALARLIVAEIDIGMSRGYSLL